VVTRDPAEGLSVDGVIVTGVAAERVPGVYRAAVADCTGRLPAVFGARLHSVYLYGSVATGQARPPESDLDLVAVWRSEVIPDEAGVVSGELSVRYAGLVREVSLASATLAQVLAADRAGLGMRCFLRHYCLCLTGTDLRATLPPCRPSRAVADGFNDDPAALVQRWRALLAAARTPTEIAAVARAAARKLLVVAATLESVEHGGWTTDRATAAALLTTHHPEWTRTAERALAWSTNPGLPTTDQVHQLLRLGDWLATRPTA